MQRIDQQPSQEAKTKPMWKGEKSTVTKPKVWLYVATPVHSDVSIHYTQSLLDIQKVCMKRNIATTFQLVKSSLVTQGRNLCVADFLSSKATHLLFIDSDISVEPETVFKMLEKDLEVIAAPYALKTVNWDRAYQKMKSGLIKTRQDLANSIFQYPIKVEDELDVEINEGVMEVTHAPTGCMLLKRSVFDKMREKYPSKSINQKTVINGELVDKPNMWNFFDTWYDEETKTYTGEDFAFCRLWKNIGGKCYCYINDFIGHTGEFTYLGRFADELILKK
tara:strand:- start:1498 stop:2331 length:834 start_codon:yes stop_codon:yes gene_type:complete